MDSVCLTWDSKPKRALHPKRVGLEAAELVMPNPSHRPIQAPETGDPPSHPLKGKNSANRLIWGDNLTAMEALVNEGYEGSVELIYIDPPFVSKTDYTHRLKVKGVVIERRAYTDTWASGMDGYLDMLFPRLRLMKRLLREKGKIFVHCDWHANSYIRVMLDEVFGRENFLNEIIWNYGGRGAKAISGQFPRNHDTILVYGRSENATIKKVYVDRVMTVKEAKSLGYREDEEGRIFKTAPRGDYTEESIKVLEKADRIHRTKNGNIRVKYFLERRRNSVTEKKLVGDVWDDIPDSMHSPVGERTAFTTQKPEALLRRIIEAATEKGDLVCDFFSGSGTTGVVSGKLGRRWIMCEEGTTGIQVSRNRLIENTRRHFTVEKVKEGHKLQAPSPCGNRLRLRKPAVKKAPGGRVEVSIGLKGYSPGKVIEGFASGRSPSKKPNDAYVELMEAARRNFALLIDYWAVDWDYDGKVFKSRWQAIRGNGKGARTVETEANAMLDKGPKRIAVRLVDIFGNEAETSVEV
jgi:DNA modification methylase